MKLPDIKKPNIGIPKKIRSNDDPEKGFRMKGLTIKNKFLQKNLLSLIAVAVLLIGTGTVYGTLNSQDADKGEDSIYGVNSDRYQVLLSGKGYKLSKQQEKNYKLQKKQNEANVTAARVAEQTNPRIIRSSTGSRIYRSGTHRYRYTSHTYKVSKRPRLSSNISEQISMAKSLKAGDTLQFRVSAYAYPYGSKNAISEDNIKVTVTGGSAKLYKSSSGYHYYEVTLREGINKISISATDKKTKKTAKIGPYTVRAGKKSSSTDPTKPTSQKPTTPTEPATIDEGITASAILTDLGLEDLELTGNVAKEDSTAFDVLKEIDTIHFKDNETTEIDYIEMDTKNFSLDEYVDDLRNIYEAEHEDESVTFDDWKDSVEKKVKEKGVIGTGYPFESTRWDYAPKDKKGKNLAKEGITLTLVLYEQ